MRFRTRAFLVCFIPFALLLTCGFAMMQWFVQARVREGLRTSLRENELAIARVHARNDLQNSRFLNIVGENPALKAGAQLMFLEPDNPAARATVEDQLRELGERMGFDFLLLSTPDGKPLAGDTRRGGGLVPLELSSLERAGQGFLLLNGRAYQVGCVPIDAADENLGTLCVGAAFDFSEYATPVVLLHAGQVIDSNVPGVSPGELKTALRNCSPSHDCDLRLRGASWISVPIQRGALGGGFELRTLENVDAAIGPLASVLHNLFVFFALASVLVAFACGMLSSRSIVKPIALVVQQLRRSAGTGVLAEFDERISSVVEIRELVDNYNTAAVAVRDARVNLQDAYVEFVGSLAHALDARDPYTAGHSKRVSNLASATAAALQLKPDMVERIRIGALLHDIGKIGIADAVLQKTGRLTDEEFALVKEHPVIGRRILEGVHGLAPFIPAVELHHENWDGSGYPKRQSAHQTPVDARIIHIADAYDAMTTDRSYRRGLTHERALEILFEYAGTQFDPYIVPVFASLPREMMTPGVASEPDASSTDIVNVVAPWETA